MQVGKLFLTILKNMLKHNYNKNVHTPLRVGLTEAFASVIFSFILIISMSLTGYRQPNTYVSIGG
jgi:hypothetical protein